MQLALAGDTMLGRRVAERLTSEQSAELFAEEVVDVAHEADLFLLNLECAISDRGQPWPDPWKPFFFRAPPVAAEILGHLGVGCVTLANNHALDFGPDALLDTHRHLEGAGIACVGAGVDRASARAPRILQRLGSRIGIVGVTDHPPDYAAGSDRPGVAYADLRRGSPPWLLETIRGLDTEVVVVSPHWGPNMTAGPVLHVRSAAAAFRDAGATLVAGHSAHVFHGVDDSVLYDLGGFIDDYATHPALRNDLGILFLVTLDANRPVRLEAVPLALDYCCTRLADRDEARWIARRFRRACASFGTEVAQHGDRLVIELGARRPRPTDIPVAAGSGGDTGVPRRHRRRSVKHSESPLPASR